LLYNYNTPKKCEHNENILYDLYLK
jgi:hypothetical protein